MEQRQDKRYAKLIKKQKQGHEERLKQVEHQLRIEQVQRHGNLERNQFYYMFDKWRILSFIQKLLHGDDMKGQERKDYMAMILVSFRNRIAAAQESILNEKEDQIKRQQADYDTLQTEKEVVDFQIGLQKRKYAELEEQLSAEIHDKAQLEARKHDVEQELKKMQDELEHQSQLVQSGKQEVEQMQN